MYNFKHILTLATIIDTKFMSNINFNYNLYLIIETILTLSVSTLVTLYHRLLWRFIIHLKVVVNNGFWRKFWFRSKYGKVWFYDFERLRFSTRNDCFATVICLKYGFGPHFFRVKICSALNVYRWFRRTHVNRTWRTSTFYIFTLHSGNAHQ